MSSSRCHGCQHHRPHLKLVQSHSNNQLDQFSWLSRGNQPTQPTRSFQGSTVKVWLWSPRQLRSSASRMTPENAWGGEISNSNGLHRLGVPCYEGIVSTIIFCLKDVTKTSERQKQQNIWPVVELTKPDFSIAKSQKVIKCPKDVWIEWLIWIMINHH